MEKVLFIVFERGDQQPASLMTTDEIIGRSTQLGVERYPDVSLQVEEREITDQWQRRGPGAYRMRAVLSVWTECADDVSDVEQVVSAISSDYAGFVVTEAMPKGRSAGFVSSVDPQPGIKVTSLLCRASSLTPTNSSGTGTRYTCRCPYASIHSGRTPATSSLVH